MPTSPRPHHGRPCVVIGLVLAGALALAGLLAVVPSGPVAAAASTAMSPVAKPELVLRNDAYFPEAQLAQPFVGESFFAESANGYDVGNPQDTAWTCRVDFGDDTPPEGYWRARFPPAPCAMYHTYAASGRYTITMTVTDPSGTSTSSRRQVRVAPRRTVQVDGGVEGTAVALAGPGGDETVQWHVVGDPSQSPYTCQLADSSAQGATLQCADQGTYVVQYDGPTTATSGEYDVRFVNGAPEPVLTPTRGARGGSEVPSPRVGTGDRVLWSVEAHDPSFFPGGPLGDSVSCSFDFGNGTTESADDYLDDRCGGSAVYDQPGTYTATVTVTDEDGASATVSSTVTVVRRDIAISVSGGQADGLRGRLHATLKPSGTAGTLSFTLPDGRSVTGRVDDIQLYGRHLAGLSGPATLAGRTGFACYVEVADTGDRAVLLTVTRGSRNVVYEIGGQAGFDVAIDAPSVG